MATIRELLQTHPPEVWTIGPEASVYQALELLAEKDVGALPVVKGAKLVGIFSERDYARNVILKGRSSKDTKVSELMSKDVLYVRPDQSVDDAMALVTSKRVRHLPVLDGAKLVGMITIGDLVKHVISMQEFTIEQLENYIRYSG